MGRRTISDPDKGKKKHSFRVGATKAQRELLDAAKGTQTLSGWALGVLLAAARAQGVEP